MLIEIRVVANNTTSKYTAKNKKFHRVVVLQCDNCSTKFEKKFHNKYINCKRHYCCDKCSKVALRRGGASYTREGALRRVENIKKTNTERHGVEFNFQREDVKEASKQTLINHYGVDNPSKSSEIKERKKKTCLKRYGVEFSAQAEQTKEKAKETFLEHYGVDHPFKAEEVKEKIKQTNLNKYGVEYPAQNFDLHKKMSDTTYERYGVECMFTHPDVRRRALETTEKRYGAKFFWGTDAHKVVVNDPVYQARVHETKKKNGTYVNSKVEQLCYEVLCTAYGEENVTRHPIINGWEIDFYVNSVNAYVQLDGVYYHGLDRPADEIKLFKTPTDVTIYGTMLRDQKQNDWFYKNNVHLVRITDLELNKDVSIVFHRLASL